MFARLDSSSLKLIYQCLHHGSCLESKATEFKNQIWSNNKFWIITLYLLPMTVFFNGNVNYTSNS